MPSKLEMVNRVLSQLGKQYVTAIDDSEASQYISNKIDELHSELLLSYDWPWAIIYREDNTPLVENFSPDYVYSYQLPADFGKFFSWSLSGPAWPLYAFMDGMLLADTRPIQYYYISNNAPYEVISALYARALVLYTAEQSALFLTNNVQLTAYLEKEFMKAKIRAIQQADMERSIRSIPYNDFNRIYFV